jgi:hypothetical protein
VPVYCPAEHDGVTRRGTVQRAGEDVVRHQCQIHVTIAQPDDPPVPVVLAPLASAAGDHGVVR